jgi:hypothetical protein
VGLDDGPCKLGPAKPCGLFPALAKYQEAYSDCGKLHRQRVDFWLLAHGSAYDESACDKYFWGRKAIGTAKSQRTELLPREQVAAAARIVFKITTFLPLQSYSCGSSLPAVSNRQRKLPLQALNSGILSN